jgi:hypothetical protein
MKHIGWWPLLKAFEHILNDLLNKILFFKEILYPCPFLIATSFGSYHRFLDSWMLLISKLLKKRFPVASLKSSLHLSHKWPQQCSVCRSGTFKFSRLFPCCDVRHYFHEKSKFDSGHVLFIAFIFIFGYWCPTRFDVVQDLPNFPEHPCF